MTNDHFIGDFYDKIFKPEIKAHSSLLNVNLADVGGRILIQFSKNLSYKSIISATRTILERVMQQNNYVFDHLSITQILSQSHDPNSQIQEVFCKLGINDNCKLKWLIETLIKIDEQNSLRGILRTYPPWIKRLCAENIGKEDGRITYEIKTISKLSVKWINNGCVLCGPYDIDAFTSTTIFINPQRGGFYFLSIEIPDFNQKLESPRTYVHDVNDPEFPILEKDYGRYALLIGMMDYNRKDDLMAAKHDIPLLNNVLRKLGFQVFSFLDLSKEHLETVLKNFSALIQNKIGVFYYAGHGFMEDCTDLISLKDNQTISTLDIRKQLTSHNPNLVLAIFDMCRTSEVGKHMSGVSKEFSYKDLITVMSSLPQKSAYEFRDKFKRIYQSVIIKPLVEILSEYGHSESLATIIPMLRLQYNKIKDQIPVFHMVGGDTVLGVNYEEQNLLQIKFRMNGEYRDNDVFIVRYRRDVINNFVVVSINAAYRHNYKIIREAGDHSVVKAKSPMDKSSQELCDKVKYNLAEIAQEINPRNSFIVKVRLLDTLRVIKLEIIIDQKLVDMLCPLAQLEMENCHAFPSV